MLDEMRQDGVHLLLGDHLIVIQDQHKVICSVQPLLVVDGSPRELVKGASIQLSCIDEKNRYEHSTKDGCL